MLSQRTQEDLLLALASATDDGGLLVRIHPKHSVFTDECLMRDFGWSPYQIQAMRAQQKAWENGAS